MNMTTLERNVAAKIEAVELKLDGRMNTIAGELTLSKWMLATLVALNVAIMLKLFLR